MPIYYLPEVPDDNEKYAHMRSNNFDCNEHGGSADDGRLLGGLLGCQRWGTVDCGSDKIPQNMQFKRYGRCNLHILLLPPKFDTLYMQGLGFGGRQCVWSLWDARDLVERSDADSSSERYRRMYEYQRDSRTDGRERAASSSW